jgi:hypothetical protein
MKLSYNGGNNNHLAPANPHPLPNLPLARGAKRLRSAKGKERNFSLPFMGVGSKVNMSPSCQVYFLDDRFNGISPK